MTVRTLAASSLLFLFLSASCSSAGRDDDKRQSSYVTPGFSSSLLVAEGQRWEVAAWRRAVEKIDQHLRQAEYRPARKKTMKLLNRVVDELGTGKDAAYTLAILCVLRAIAEAGLGYEDDALWYWWTAYNVFNDITKTDLSPYGEPAAFLQGSSFRSRDGLADISTEGCLVATEPVVVRMKGESHYPLMMRRMGVTGRYSAQVVVETDGSISGPLVGKEVREPTMVYAVLETLRRWEFEPAKLEGEPIPCLYGLSVNFELRGLPP